MTDYNMFKALEVCMKQARKQAVDGGIETCIMVASVTNIPQEGSTAAMTDEISIERMMTWGSPDESKCDFVRKYVRDHRGKDKAPTMAWDAEIAFGNVDYYYDKNSYAFTIGFGVLADTTANSKAILKYLRETFNAVKAWTSVASTSARRPWRRFFLAEKMPRQCGADLQ